jgi:hypothetical protein
MAQHYFGKSSALAKQFQFGEANRPPAEIIGVVADSTYSNLREKRSDVIYLPAAKGNVFEVRCSGDPRSLAAPVRELIRSLILR